MALAELNANESLALAELNANESLALAELDATKALEKLEILQYSDKIFEFSHKEHKWSEEFDKLCQIFLDNLGNFEIYISDRKTQHLEKTAVENVLYILNDNIHFHLGVIGILARQWMNIIHIKDEYILFTKYINDIISSCFDVCDFRFV